MYSPENTSVETFTRSTKSDTSDLNVYIDLISVCRFNNKLNDTINNN